jgi:nitroreductase
MLKQYLRSKLIACPACHMRYKIIKYRIQSIISLRYFIYDIAIVHRSMFWKSNGAMNQSQLQAKLLFFYHKIEKGLCMPGKQRLFGTEVVHEVMTIVTSWQESKFNTSDPIYLGAIKSLKAYANRVTTEKLDPKDLISTDVNTFLNKCGQLEICADTPLKHKKINEAGKISFENLNALYIKRRSVRNFDKATVSKEILENAVAAAQLSPSACNRQPCRVIAITNETLRTSLLSHQNGNAGFGHLAPLLLVITANADHFFGAIERSQPYVDGGMFCMSLLYALEVQGLATCCLNWCVTPETDSEVHKILDIPESQKIIMYIAVGYADQHAMAPKSHRKSLADVLVVK